jgi:hypothetical protein
MKHLVGRGIFPERPSGDLCHNCVERSQRMPTGAQLDCFCRLPLRLFHLQARYHREDRSRRTTSIAVSSALAVKISLDHPTFLPNSTRLRQERCHNTGCVPLESTVPMLRALHGRMGTLRHATQGERCLGGRMIMVP